MGDELDLLEENTSSTVVLGIYCLSLPLAINATTDKSMIDLPSQTTLVMQVLGVS